MIERILDDLVEAWRWDEYDRAESLAESLRQLGKKALLALDQALKAEDNVTRQAAAFALGVLGTKAALKRLQEQLAIEEASGDYDAASVIEVITSALARIKGAESRSVLARRLKRMASQNPEKADVIDIVQALWMHRHPDLIPAVLEATGQIQGDAALPLLVLATMLERISDYMALWVADPSVPIQNKRLALVILEADFPTEWVPALTAFVHLGVEALQRATIADVSEAEGYCERLMIAVVLNANQLLPAMSPDTRKALQSLAEQLLAAKSVRAALRAADLLGYISTPESIPLLEAHRPTDKILAVSFDRAIEKIRERAGRT